MDNIINNTNILIYQTEDGKTKIETRLENETAWLTIDQMSELFQKSRSTINEHIINIYDENELQKEETMRKIGISDFLKKPQEYERLDLDYLEFSDSSLQSAKFAHSTFYRGK